MRLWWTGPNTGPGDYQHVRGPRIERQQKLMRVPGTEVRGLFLWVEIYFRVVGLVESAMAGIGHIDEPYLHSILL